jgi:hypothetical protein
MTDVGQITQIIMQWADKCAELYGLEPSRREYKKEVRSRVYEVTQDRIPPRRFDTLTNENSWLFETLKYRI